MTCLCLILRNLVRYIHGSRNTSFIVMLCNNEKYENVNGIWKEEKSEIVYVFVATHLLLKYLQPVKHLFFTSFVMIYFFQCTCKLSSKGLGFFYVPRKGSWPVIGHYSVFQNS
jgi:hypothetical protein